VLDRGRREADVDGTPFGRYRLIELLGRGGMGEVWRAYDSDTDRIVALKVLPGHLSEDEEFQRRFRREAHAAARLNSPHVIPIHHYGEIDGRLYLDMRLIMGRDLATVLAEGPLDPTRAIHIVGQVAEALHAAHEEGLLHRDIKPSNILLDKNDFAYLIDFGIARAADETRMTKSGSVIGTYHYIAPERLTVGADEDARADIYSLACVLYECLTGSPPFPGDTMPQLVGAHLYAPPPRPSTSQPQVPAPVDEVIARGMAKDPDQRYATTIELADAARDAITVPIARPIPTPTQPATQRVVSPAPGPALAPPASRLQPPLGPRASDATQRDLEQAATNLAHFGSGATADQPPPQRSPYPPPRLPSAAQELTAPKRPSRGTKITLAVCASVIVAIAAVVIAFNALGGNTRDVQVPDVRGQVSADAIAALQNRGFKTRTQQRPDSTIPPDHVINTDPGANASMGAGDVITINVSTGPEQREVPDISAMSYADGVNKLKAAGFIKFKQTNSPSTPELLGKVIGTNPPANQTTAITSVINVIVGSGPEPTQTTVTVIPGTPPITIPLLPPRP